MSTSMLPTIRYHTTATPVEPFDPVTKIRRTRINNMALCARYVPGMTRRLEGGAGCSEFAPPVSGCGYVYF